MAGIMRVFTFLLAVAFSAEVLGYHAQILNTLLCVIFVVSFLWPYLNRESLSQSRQRWPGLLLIFISIAGLLSSTGWISVFCISLLIGGLRLLRLDETHDPDLKLYQTVAFAYGLFIWFWHETATGWYVLNGITNALMFVTHHLGLTAKLGPTASGLPLIILFLIYGLTCSIYLPEKRLITVLKLVASLIVIQIVFTAVYDVSVAALSLNFAHPNAQRNTVAWFPFAYLQFFYPNNLQGIAFLLGLAVTLLLIPAQRLNRNSNNAIKPQWRAIAVGALILLMGVALAGFVPPRPAARGQVLIYDNGKLDFRVPVFGSFGHKNSGMFGSLPGFLEASGYHVKRGVISKKNLKSANILVIINPMDKFDRNAKQAIWNFVQRGGGLLVLGDHTCTTSIREPINDLLSRVNIELNFDSAKPFRDGWLGAYTLPRHITTASVDDVMNGIQIWIGASLSTKPPVRPVIIGNYGFSDPGDMTNLRDGHLGNLKFDAGEKLSDMLLAAECQYGRGKVMVFGDTSSLQNDALASSYQFVENIFAWLSRPQKPALDLTRHCAAALLILMGLILLVRQAKWRSWPTAAASIFLIGWALGIAPSKLMNISSTAHNNIAWIDTSHLERFNINNMWIDEGTGGLILNLMRNGYAPRLMKTWDLHALKRGSLLILNAPSRSFSPSEINQIRQFVRNGGYLILASGWDDRSGSNEIWNEYGLQLEPRPLGRVLVKHPEGEVRLYRGWSIKSSSYNSQTLCSPWGYPVIVKIRDGKGGVVAIADSCFLLNRNLEGTEKYCPQNIGFLSRLFRQIQNKDKVALSSDLTLGKPGNDIELRRSPVQKGGQ